MAQKSDPWMSISDMMTTLMLVFMFLAISYMIDVSKEKSRMKEIAVTYSELQNDLYSDLNDEFKDDLTKWNALLDKESLSIRFEEPDILFSVGSCEIKPAFADILSDFFPRYINILTNEKYKNDIEEIRIEGHTSSEWADGVSGDIGYFKNMELSQNRTRRVLEYVLSLPFYDTIWCEKQRARSEITYDSALGRYNLVDVSDTVTTYSLENVNTKKWTMEKLTANGLSSSKPILGKNGFEDKSLSRRVEFRVRTNAEKRIANILEQ